MRFGRPGSSAAGGREPDQAFPLKGGLLNRTTAVVQAVDRVSFDVRTGETLDIVGDSGCGKSTTARLLMHLIAPDSGSIVFDGLVVGAAEGGIGLRDLHRQMQMVFPDSFASLNPRLPWRCRSRSALSCMGWPNLPR